MSKLERLHELQAITKRIRGDEADAAESLKALMLFADEMDRAPPGVLKVCDAYIESETELRYLKKEFWQKNDWETAKQEAEARLEEMLG